MGKFHWTSPKKKLEEFKEKKMINNITMQCNAVKDPAKIENPNLSLVRLRVACNEEKEERETLFIDAFFYGKSADNCLKLVKKGSPLLLVGRLVSRSYENKDGKKVTEIQIAVNNWQLLNRKPKEEKEEKGTYEVPVIEDKDLPF